MAIPSRDKIKKELVLYLSQQQERRINVTPEMAYEALAHVFNLTEADLLLRRPTGEERWPNEVRYARWELVDEGIILPTEQSKHGVWKLAETTTPKKSTFEFPDIYSDLEDEGVFDPASISDARDIILRAIVQRRGQFDFRTGLLKAYEFKCAVTSEDFAGVLEAAHITPYLGLATIATSNGLLLRADIHTLFDLFLLSVNPSTYHVAISQKLQDSGYAVYHDKPIFLPQDLKNHPSAAALEEHWNKCKL